MISVKDVLLYGTEEQKKQVADILQEALAIPHTDEPDENHVYIAQFGPYFKIGFSNNPASRIKDLSTGNPYNGVLIWTLTGFRKTYKVEYNLHRKFSYCRITGEWFKLSTVDFEWIKKTFGRYLTEHTAPDFTFEEREIAELKEKLVVALYENRQLKQELEKFSSFKTELKHIKIKFGKYAGRKLYTALAEDPQYFRYILENAKVDEDLKLLLETYFEIKKKADELTYL